MPKRLIALGEILFDLIVPPGESLATTGTLAVREGGAPMNAAIAAARLGVPVGFCGVVGDDALGLRLKGLLDHEGVDTTALRTLGGEPTSLAFAWKDAAGDGHFRLLRLADRHLAVSDLDRAGIENAEAILVGSVALAAEPSREAITTAVRRAAEVGVPVIFDINVRPTLWASVDSLAEAVAPLLPLTDVLKVSLDDASHLWGVGTAEEAIAKAREFDPWLILVTDGSRGVVVGERGVPDLRRFPVFTVEAIDPTGAGDAFTGGLISRLVSNGWTSPSDDDIRFAMAAGALATTKQGAIPALPTREEALDFLAKQSPSLLG